MKCRFVLSLARLGPHRRHIHSRVSRRRSSPRTHVLGLFIYCFLLLTGTTSPRSFGIKQLNWLVRFFLSPFRRDQAKTSGVKCKSSEHGETAPSLQIRKFLVDSRQNFARIIIGGHKWSLAPRHVPVERTLTTEYRANVPISKHLGVETFWALWDMLRFKSPGLEY